MINFINNNKSFIITTNNKEFLLANTIGDTVKNIVVSENLAAKLYKTLTSFEFNLASSIQNNYIKRVFVLNDDNSTPEDYKGIVIYVKDQKNILINFNSSDYTIKMHSNDIPKLKAILKSMELEPHKTYGKYSMIKEVTQVPVNIGAGEVLYFHQQKKAFISNKGKIEEFEMQEPQQPQQEVPPVESVAYALKQKGVTIEKFEAPEVYQLDKLPENVDNINGGLYYYNNTLHENKDGIPIKSKNVTVVYNEIPHNYQYPKDTLVYEEPSRQMYLFTSENNKLDLVTSNVTKNNKPSKDGAYITSGKFVRVSNGQISEFPGLEGMNLPIQYSKQYLHELNSEYYVRGASATIIVAPKKGLISNRDVIVTDGSPSFTYRNGDKAMVGDTIYQYSVSENKWLTIK